MPEERYPYGGPDWLFLLGALVAGGGATGLLVEVSQGHAVTLGPVTLTGAALIGVALVCFAVAGVAIALVLRGRALGPRMLVIGDGWIEAPRSVWTRATVRIERAAITKVERVAQSRARFVVLEAASERLALSSTLVGEEGIAAVERWLESPPRTPSVGPRSGP